MHVPHLLNSPLPQLHAVPWAPRARLLWLVLPPLLMVPGETLIALQKKMFSHDGVVDSSRVHEQIGQRDGGF